MNEYQEALKKFSIDPGCLPPSIHESIQQYCVLLWHKNQVMNLTRHTTWDSFVSRDLVDTLELSKLIGPGCELLDVGTGGGVPGLLLALIRPDLQVNLTDSVGKKAIALAEFADALGVNVQIYHERSENLLEDLRYDVTTVRAVGSLTKICRWFAERWLNVNRLLAIKGPNWESEWQEARAAGLCDGVSLKVVSCYPTPGAEWNSYILELRPN